MLFMGLYNLPLVLKLMGDHQDLPVSYRNSSECSILDTRQREGTLLKTKYKSPSELCKRMEQNVSLWLQVNLSLAHLPVSGPWLAQDLF